MFDDPKALDANSWYNIHLFLRWFWIYLPVLVTFALTDAYCTRNHPVTGDYRAPPVKRPTGPGPVDGVCPGCPGGGRYPHGPGHHQRHPRREGV